MPKPAITRVSSMVVDPNYNINLSTDVNTSQGFYVPQLTTAQINAIAAPTLQNGGLVYNTTTNTFQAYEGGAWTNLSTGAVNALEAPAVANAAALPAVPVNGMIVYQTDIGLFKIYQTPPDGAGWSAIYANVSVATGVGLVAGNSPYSLPSGTLAAVEVAGNQVNGFAYYNTTGTNVRGYFHGVWTTIETTTNAATGVGLAAGNTPVVLPNGASGTVEVAGNQVNGFIYYNTTGTNVRAYVNGAWGTVTIV